MRGRSKKGQYDLLDIRKCFEKIKSGLDDLEDLVFRADSSYVDIYFAHLPDSLP